MILQWILQEDYRILTGQGTRRIPSLTVLDRVLSVKEVYIPEVTSYVILWEDGNGNSQWSQTSSCSLFNGVACYIVVRWSLFIVCLIVYCFCLVLFVNVVGTQFLFLRRLNLLNTFQCKVLNDDISMDSMRKKFIFMHSFPHNCSMKFKKLWFSPSLTGSAE